MFPFFSLERFVYSWVTKGRVGRAGIGSAWQERKLSISVVVNYPLLMAWSSIMFYFSIEVHIPWRIHGAAIYGAPRIPSTKTPVMLAYISIIHGSYGYGIWLLASAVLTVAFFYLRTAVLHSTSSSVVPGHSRLATRRWCSLASRGAMSRWRKYYSHRIHVWYMWMVILWWFNGDQMVVTLW